MLIRNVSGETSNLCSIYIRASPFGANPPSVPTARIATLARIASPASLDRSYQSAFLHALRFYFARRKRLVKKGDVIAVRLNARYMDEGDDAGEPLLIDYHDAPLQADLCVSSHKVAKDPPDRVVYLSADDVGRGPDAVVFFVVSNVEHGIVAAAAASDVKGQGDAYFGSTTGELGCWIDSAITRLVQTGLEHSFVPDVTSYLGLSKLKGHSYSVTVLRHRYNQLTSYLRSSERLAALWSGRLL